MIAINILTSDSQPLTLSVKAAHTSAFFHGLLGEFEDENLTDEIPIPYPADVLRKVFDFMEHHADTPMAAIQAPVSSDFEKELSEYDREFIKVPLETIKTMLEIANYLSVDSLLDLLCAKIASLILATADDKASFEKTFNLSKLTKKDEENIEVEFNKFYKN